MSRQENRLAREASPYLRQHMHNPVDWFPWGAEAFELARREQRPILLSVGYAACHWCHVMEHDAFEVDAVAALMNRHFVSIKVDREERPDVDQLYQGVVQLMGRGGGWPLTVFLTPELRPFFGGTYFPPVDRHGLPGFSRLLSGLADAWATRREEVLESAASFHEGLGRLATLGLSGEPGPLSATDLVEAGKRILGELDAVHGGFFGAPKFPHAMELSFLLRLATSALPRIDPGTRQAAEAAVRLSLGKLARGGIYDQLAGGFARYSVDERWAVPHFEKMLYDNALLLRLFAEAAVALGDPLHARVAREIAAYLARELQGPDGGFYSSQDADSEGVEGKFFVFTRSELDELLGAELGALCAAHLGVTERGNFEHGSTVLHLALTAAELATARGEDEGALERKLAEGRAKLLAARSLRVPPATDDKVLAGWNGLAIGALAAAGRLLGEPAMIESARRAATFVLGTLVKDGRLQRVTREGKVQQDAFVDDHAFLLEGLLELFEATGEPAWLDEAQRLAKALVERFWDEEAALFFVTPVDGEALLHRQPSAHDNALPSGASSAVVGLLRLAALAGDERAAAVAGRYLAARREALLSSPFGFGHLLCGAYLEVAGLCEVAVLGPRGDARELLLATARSKFRPEIMAFAGVSGPGLLSGLGQPPRPAAHVCRRFACEAPREDPRELQLALGFGGGEPVARG